MSAFKRVGHNKTAADLAVVRAYYLDLIEL